ncbi:uncharacterized protein LOC112576605 [Pomacea canaliculata]|uniref:uncharacterized protein LOC112576605 n=1 Tax=Pomacea canaliculata TaxID=400727 RepID=UPI000D733D21|nr:uncharacterized protein LOC112576605 [Pomacea canaliculata]
MSSFFRLRNETNSSCPDLTGKNYRASFHTRSSAKGVRKKIYRAHLEGDGPRKGEHAVVKVFRHAKGTESMCDEEIFKHIIARRLSRKFNKLVNDTSDKITFTLPLKSTVEKVGVGSYLLHRSRTLDKEEWVLIEENLAEYEEYKAFLRKNGEKARKDPSSLDAFLHFTYHESGQKFVLCGFQGIHTEEQGYKLTTPCIHSVEKKYGLTDKGASGIKSVFAKHKCNNLCWNWPTPGDEIEDDKTCSNGEVADTNGEEADINDSSSDEKFDSVPIGGLAIHTTDNDSSVEDILSS